MSRPVVLFGCIIAVIGWNQVGASAEKESPAQNSAILNPDDVFAESDDLAVIRISALLPDSATIEQCTVEACSFEEAGSCTSCGVEACGQPMCCCCSKKSKWTDGLFGSQPLLHDFRDRSAGDFMSYSIGGELRYRYLDERNRLRPPGPGRSTYDQWRFVPFLELNFGDDITGYVEAIDAATFNEDLPVVPIDENRSDLLQYYVDINLGDFDGGTFKFRVGRQLLLYGSQHLVSPLAWANTFRNFEGFRLYYEGGDWDLDAFAVRPVNGAALNTFRPRSFDNPDQSRWFSGIYATYKGLVAGPVDFYWLWLRENEPRMAIMDGNRHTLGMRWAGAMPVDQCCQTVRTYIWDVEGAWQVGEDDFRTGMNQDVSAGFLSVMGGHTWNQASGSPTLKGVFYWGSGDEDPTDGTINTVSTLFPLGHAYWGLIDNFSGQNLVDYSVQASVKPHEKLTFLTAWHWFDKDESNDFIYNIAGVGLGPQVTDRNIGNELDLVATYAANENLALQLGYFWFWYGDAVNRTALARPDAHQFYFMTTLGF